MVNQFSSAFPILKDVAAKKTSETSQNYNCIAWAFGDNQRHWWPNSRRSYWPLNASQHDIMGAFEAWFEVDGWEITVSVVVEEGYDKVALFALDGKPTHAARLLDNGLWTSKLGANIDISHKLYELNGPEYGEMLRIYRKPRT